MVFGKQESGFELAQELIDEIVLSKKEWLTGAMVPFYPSLPPYILRPLVHLCISGTPTAYLGPGFGWRS